MSDLRQCAVAGKWYPGTASELARAIDGHLAAAGPPEVSCPRALIAPHAGLMYSGPVAAHAYASVASCRYSSVILVGPSHFVGFRGVAIWPRGAWDSPFGAVTVDEELSAALLSESGAVIEHEAAHGREHSLELQLPFIARLLPGVPIVPLVMGFQTRETADALGDALAPVVAAYESHRRRVLLVGSSDLSHYEDAPTAARMDGVVMGHVEALDASGLMDALEREPGHACGGGPMVAVLRAAVALGASQARVLHYADSGDVSGDKSSVVGYMAAAVW